MAHLKYFDYHLITKILRCYGIFMWAYFDNACIKYTSDFYITIAFKISYSKKIRETQKF